MSQDVEKIWSLGFLPGNLESHPGKRLIDHLKNTDALSENFADIYELPIDKNILKGAALTHDLAKAHLDFQAYLKKKGSGVNHAEPSSWFTYILTNNVWAAEIVRRHHTYLRNCNSLADEWLPDEVTMEKVIRVMEEYLPQWPLPLTEQKWRQLEDYLFDGLEVSIDLWLSVRLKYSLLIAADRMEALGISNYLPSKIPPCSSPNFEIKTQIDVWRNDTKNVCLIKAKQVEKPGVYTLTLPTGAGKTLLGLQIASLWARKFNSKSIIYALPFISIVEQNAAEAQKVFGQNVQEDHSLAYQKKPDHEHKENYETETWHKMMSLFRYWREPIIVTTMVQLWEALFNEYANKSMNFHKLSHSVVIMDEPQSIPPRLWKGLSDTLNFLSKKLNATFLFMTATQPQIKATAEIAPRDLERPFERHRYLVDRKKYEISELGKLLLAKLPVHDGSGLVVLNTKKAALQAYKIMTLKEIITDAPVLFLSAWMVPLHRKRVLDKLHKLEKNKRKRYLVSTQVVEAGVNLDFDWVFRDFGPLDSIVQVAGRCNRHLKEGYMGKVMVAEILNGNIPYCARVYNDILINAAREVLFQGKEETVEFGENEVPQLVNKYYKKILDNGINSEPIYENLANGIWEGIPKLIEKRNYEEVDVIVELDDKVRGFLEQLQSKKWTLEERAEQKELIRKLQQYMIAIPKDYVPLCRRKVSNISTNDYMEPFAEVFNGTAYFMTKDGIKSGLYDDIVGFIPPEDDNSGLSII